MDEKIEQSLRDETVTLSVRSRRNLESIESDRFSAVELELGSRETPPKNDRESNGELEIQLNQRFEQGFDEGHSKGHSEGVIEGLRRGKAQAEAELEDSKRLLEEKIEANAAYQEKLRHEVRTLTELNEEVSLTLQKFNETSRQYQIDVLLTAFRHLLKYEIITKKSIAAIVDKIIVENKSQQVITVAMGSRLYDLVYGDDNLNVSLNTSGSDAEQKIVELTENNDENALYELQESLGDFEFEVRKPSGFLSIDIQAYIEEILNELKTVVNAELKDEPGE
jgi:flagellar biosynthesis/type III secretory pathway protein FliH